MYPAATLLRKCGAEDIWIVNERVVGDKCLRPVKCVAVGERCYPIGAILGQPTTLMVQLFPDAIVVYGAKRVYVAKAIYVKADRVEIDDKTVPHEWMPEGILDRKVWKPSEGVLDKPELYATFDGAGSGRPILKWYFYVDKVVYNATIAGIDVMDEVIWQISRALPRKIGEVAELIAALDTSGLPPEFTRIRGIGIEALLRSWAVETLLDIAERKAIVRKEKLYPLPLDEFGRTLRERMPDGVPI